MILYIEFLKEFNKINRINNIIHYKTKYKLNIQKSVAFITLINNEKKSKIFYLIVLEFNKRKRNGQSPERLFLILSGSVFLVQNRAVWQ